VLLKKDYIHLALKENNQENQWKILDDKKIEKRPGLMGVVFIAYFTSFLFPRIFKMQFIRNFVMKKGFARVYDLFEKINNSPEASKTLWGQMATKQTEGDRETNSLSWKEYVIESVALLLAGFETTSITLSLTLWHLHKNPEILKKAKEEIKRVMQGNRPSAEYFGKLPFLEKVILESLRLTPVVALMEREVVQDEVLSGYRIPTGSLVQLAPHYLIKNTVENPDKFDPERFTQEKMDSLSQIAHAGFGHGPHVCIGKAFAFMELRLMLSYVLQKDEITIDPNQDPLVDPHAPVVMPLRIFATKKVKTN